MKKTADEMFEMFRSSDVEEYLPRTSAFKWYKVLKEW
jgi:hypothetical protein